MAEKLHLNPFVKLALDLGPLVLFFVVNAKVGIFAATAAFMAAVIVALVVSYVMIRRFPIMTVVSAIIVLVFGGLPTLIYLLFACVLAGGLIMKKPLLSVVFDSVFHLTNEGWRILTFRWSAFFFAMAILNEIVWRTQTTDFWVSFKLFGFVPLTFLFALAQMPLMKRHDASGTL
jgi:intracellular septation protein